MQPASSTAAAPRRPAQRTSASTATRPGAGLAPAPVDAGERSGTLARGLALLESLTSAAQPMTLGELAAATALDQSTAHRLLKTLEDCRYVVRHDATRRYSPSPKLLHPLPMLHPLDQLRREAAPVLRELAQKAQLTIVFVLFVGNERLVIDMAQVPGSLTPYYGTWLQGPLHATGGGKCLLMTLDPAQRSALLGPSPWPACTPHTLTDSAALEADLESSIRRGYVVSRDEHRQGVTNVAAPIRRWTGGAAGCLIATALSQDLADSACASVGAQVLHAAGMLVLQAPSLETASRFCGR